MSAANFKKDAEELMRLLQLTEITNVKHILSVEAEKLRKLAEEEEKICADAPPKVVRSHTVSTKIVNYAWDQSDKFLKIYVTLNGVQNLPTENIKAEYSTKFFELQVVVAENRNNVLTIKNLLHEIVPSDSYHKVKTDMIVLYLKKQTPQNWSYVTEAERKAKEPKAPKMDKEEDPGASLMTLMKQMYEDGDDDMKRTIAKAWTEARDKKSPDEQLL